MVPVIGGEGSSVKYPVVTRATLVAVYKVMMAILEKKLTYGVTKDPIWSKAEDDFQSSDILVNTATASVLSVHKTHILVKFLSYMHLRQHPVL